MNCLEFIIKLYTKILMHTFKKSYKLYYLNDFTMIYSFKVISGKV
jgi:hypothetical protein